MIYDKISWNQVSGNAKFDFVNMCELNCDENYDSTLNEINRSSDYIYTDTSKKTENLSKNTNCYFH